MPRSLFDAVRRAVLLAFGAIAGLTTSFVCAGPLPGVASINLCADQLVLMLADPSQIRTVSWLAADPNESVLAAEAARYPLNYGSAEELLHYRPDVVIAGAYTNGFTRALAARLGYRVVDLEPENTIAEIVTNLRIVAQAIGRVERGEELVAKLDAEWRGLDATRPAHALASVVVLPGGFTIGDHSLPDELMKLAGISNVAAAQGLDRWGSLSMETLVRSAPELIVLTDYRLSEPSLANSVLQHPALRALGRLHRTATVPARYWNCGLPQSLEAAAILKRAASAP